MFLHSCVLLLLLTPLSSIAFLTNILYSLLRVASLAITFAIRLSLVPLHPDSHLSLLQNSYPKLVDWRTYCSHLCHSISCRHVITTSRNSSPNYRFGQVPARWPKLHQSESFKFMLLIPTHSSLCHPTAIL